MEIQWFYSGVIFVYGYWPIAKRQSYGQNLRLVVNVTAELCKTVLV